VGASQGLPERVAQANDRGIVAIRQGRFDDALRIFDDLIASHPDEAALHNNRGSALKRGGQLDAAVLACGRALELKTDYAEAHANLASCLRELRRLDEAVQHLEKALAIRPDAARIYCNLGNVQVERGDLEAARDAYERSVQCDQRLVRGWLQLGATVYSLGHIGDALRILEKARTFVPDDASVNETLGALYMETGDEQPAADALARALAADASRPGARYLQCVLRGEQPEAPPEGYVRGLFDGYADHFDRHLLQGLGYRIPELLLQVVAPLLGAPESALRVVDLGCGTGLCGAAFEPWCGRLEGIDSAPKMLDHAVRRGMYDAVHLGEMSEVLAAHAGEFDLAIAGDVFPYMGNLAPIFDAVAGALMPEGLFAFSVERFDGPGWSLLESGRYAHSESCIRDLADGCGFEVLQADEVVGRTDRGEPVWQVVLVLRRSAPVL